MSVNSCTFVGNVGKSPEIKTFENGNKVAELSIATEDGYKDKSGQWVVIKAIHEFSCSVTIYQGELVVDINAETAEQRFDADFVIMTETLSQLVHVLLEYANIQQTHQSTSTEIAMETSEAS